VRRGRGFVFVAVVLIVVAMSCVMALASPGRTLSPSDIHRLNQGQIGLIDATLPANSAFKEKVALAGCKQIGASTRLMETQRASCVALAKYQDVRLELLTVFKKCGLHVPGSYSCLTPVYRAVADAIRTQYTANLRASIAASQLGFEGKCLRALADTKAELKTERRYVVSASTQASDSVLEAEYADGRVAASQAPDASQLDADWNNFLNTQAAVMQWQIWWSGTEWYKHCRAG
jgi:hypothetical protein